MRTPVEPDRPLGQPVGAEDGAGDLGLAGADEPVEADHLAASDVERHVTQQMVRQVLGREGDGGVRA